LRSRGHPFHEDAAETARRPRGAYFSCQGSPAVAAPRALRRVHRAESPSKLLARVDVVETSSLSYAALHATRARGGCGGKEGISPARCHLFFRKKARYRRELRGRSGGDVAVQPRQPIRVEKAAGAAARRNQRPALAERRGYARRAAPPIPRGTCQGPVNGGGASRRSSLKLRPSAAQRKAQLYDMYLGVLENFL
jgi:hypothetical protein